MSSVNFLEKLLDGVAVDWKALGDVIKLEKGRQLNKELLSDSGLYPAYNGGVSYSGFTDSFNYEQDKTIISQGGASAGFVNFVTTRFYANAHCYVVLPNIHVVVNRYVYHILKFNQERLTNKQHGAGIPALRVNEVLEITIPIPCPEHPEKSLEIQAEIVRILDAMTAHTAELTAELTARKKQYNYYRDKLLSFEGSEVEWKTLNKIYQFSSGLSKSADQFGFGSPFLSYKSVFNNIDVPNELETLVNTSATEQDRFSIKKGDVFITRTSESLDELGMSCAATKDYPKATFNGFTKRLRPNVLLEIDPKFSAYFFRSNVFRQQIARIAVLSTRISLNDSILANIKIPVPSIKEQAKIVAILDKFDALTSSLTEGLPREIELRQKQYAHYRDLLLSFPKPEMA